MLRYGCGGGGAAIAGGKRGGRPLGSQTNTERRKGIETRGRKNW